MALQRANDGLRLKTIEQDRQIRSLRAHCMLQNCKHPVCSKDRHLDDHQATKLPGERLVSLSKASSSGGCCRVTRGAPQAFNQPLVIGLRMQFWV